jgi:hypothetical protein
MGGRDGSACGHADPQARQRAAGRHQRKYALGVGPQRQWKQVRVIVLMAVVVGTLLASSLLSAQTSKSIAIQVSETTGIRRTEYPVSAHLNMPKGALSDASHAKLRLNDAETPAQFSLQSQWDDGSVRDLDVDFNVSIGPGESRTYSLDYGAAVSATPPARGLSIDESAEGITVGNVKFGRSGSPLLVSANYRGEFIGSGSNGVSIGDPSGLRHALSAAESVKLAIVKRGPLLVELQYTGRLALSQDYAVPFTITCEMPNSKSWVKTSIVVSDPGRRVKELALETPLSFGDRPWLWDFGGENGTYGAFRNAGDSVRLQQTIASSGNTWDVQTGTQGELRPYESAAANRAKTVFGWGHMLDAARAVAFGIDRFGTERGKYTIALSGQGQMTFRLEPEVPKTEHRLTIYQHFVATPVPIGAATSPTAMVNPLAVVVK